MRGVQTSLTPSPQKLELGTGRVTLPARTTLVLDERARAAGDISDRAARLLSQLGCRPHLGPPGSDCGPRMHLSLGPSAGLPEQGYRLGIDASGVHLSGVATWYFWVSTLLGLT